MSEALEKAKAEFTESCNNILAAIEARKTPGTVVPGPLGFILYLPQAECVALGETLTGLGREIRSRVRSDYRGVRETPFEVYMWATQTLKEKLATYSLIGMVNKTIQTKTRTDIDQEC